MSEVICCYNLQPTIPQNTASYCRFAHSCVIYVPVQFVPVRTQERRTKYCRSSGRGQLHVMSARRQMLTMMTVQQRMTRTQHAVYTSASSRSCVFRANAPESNMTLTTLTTKYHSDWYIVRITFNNSTSDYNIRMNFRLRTIMNIKNSV